MINLEKIIARLAPALSLTHWEQRRTLRRVFTTIDMVVCQYFLAAWMVYTVAPSWSMRENRHNGELVSMYMGIWERILYMGTRVDMGVSINILFTHVPMHSHTIVYPSTHEPIYPWYIHQYNHFPWTHPHNHPHAYVTHVRIWPHKHIAHTLTPK